MKNILLLSSLICAMPSYAQIPGRLFFTPAERIAIDQDSTMPATEERYRLDGTMKRSGGQSTYWINGQPGHRPNPALAVGDSNEAPLIPGNSIRIHRTKGPQ